MVTRVRTLTASILLSGVALIALPITSDLSIISQARAQEQTQTDPLLEEFAVVVRLQEAGKFQEVIDRGTALAEKVKARDGENSVSYAFVLNQVATAHAALGHGPQADELFKRALAIREQVRGKDHPEVATTLNNLGELYRANGRFAEAGEYYKRALAIVEKLSEAQALHAIILNNLALTNQVLGLNPQADELYRRALKIYEQVFGPDHPNVAITLNNLAEMYRGLARYAEAEPLYKRALAIQEQGAEKIIPRSPRPSTIWASSTARTAALRRPANITSARSRSWRNSPRLKRCTPSSSTTLPSPTRCSAVNPQADELFRRALEINEKVFGPDNPERCDNAQQSC